MFETIDKIMLAGLGALSMTRQRAEQLFDEYLERGKAARAGRSGFVKEVMDTAENTRSELAKLVGEQLDKAVKKVNFATKDDIKRLETKIDKLLKKG